MLLECRKRQGLRGGKKILFALVEGGAGALLQVGRSPSRRGQSEGHDWARL